jgi:hypothetical protein
MIGALRTLLVALLITVPSAAAAHSGPPFPVVSDRIAGPYRLSLWTDPDTTDDGRPGGQFWVRIDPAGAGRELSAGTRATVTIQSVEAGSPALRGAAVPVNGDVTNQFVALVMNREGRFAVHVDVDGPLGPASLEANVDATYDLRPPPYLLVVYALPFVLVGIVWLKVLARRRR